MKSQGEGNLILSAIHIMGSEFHMNAVNKGFWPLNEDGSVNTAGRNKGEMIALMHSELSEALEGIRKAKPVIEESTGKVVSVLQLMDEHCPEFTSEEVELADCAIRLFEYCAAFKLRIGEAILAKHQYNLNRPHKHGKAF